MQSAQKGYSRAQYYLGEMYEKGQGVDQDYAEAIKWYDKAADSGYGMAEDRVAVLQDKIEKSNHKKLAQEAERKRRADAAAAAAAAEEAARKRLSLKAKPTPPKAQKVSRKTPAVAPPPPSTSAVLLKGGWNKRNKPAEYLPSSKNNCKKTGKTIECMSKMLKRNIGMADIEYETKAIIYSMKPTGTFKISYRNNVKKVTVTDPEFLESGAEVPVKEGWQDAEHKLSCEVQNERAIVCSKNKTRKIRFNR